MKTTSCPGDKVTAAYHCLVLHKRDNERDSAEIGPSKTPYSAAVTLSCHVQTPQRDKACWCGVTCPVSLGLARSATPYTCTVTR
jgi:hypothetical protein